jgi:hypothetical protein
MSLARPSIVKSAERVGAYGKSAGRADHAYITNVRSSAHAAARAEAFQPGRTRESRPEPSCDFMELARRIVAQCFIDGRHRRTGQVSLYVPCGWRAIGSALREDVSPFDQRKFAMRLLLHNHNA